MGDLFIKSEGVGSAVGRSLAKRTAAVALSIGCVLGVGVAVSGAASAATPNQPVATAETSNGVSPNGWVYIGNYPTHAACQSAGITLVHRDPDITAYQCDQDLPSGDWALSVYET